MNKLFDALKNKETVSEVNLSGSFWKNNKRNFIIASFFNIIMVLIALGFQETLRIMVDIKMGKDLVIVVVVVVILIALSFPSYRFYSKYRAIFVAKAIRQYKNTITDKIMEKGIGTFKSESTSTYVSGLTNDCTVIEENILLAIFEVSGMILSGLGAIFLMMKNSVLLTIVALMFSVLPLVYSIISGKKLTPIEERVSVKNTNYVKIVQEALNGFPVIKSFQAEKKIIELIGDENNALEDIKEERIFLQKFIELLGGISGMITQQGVLIFGAVLILLGKKATGGILVESVLLLGMVFGPVFELPVWYSKFTAAKGLIHKMEDALSNDSKGAMVDFSTDTFCTHNKGIKLENVNYSYDGEKTVLNRFSYFFEKNKSYAIVGASGCGKSTLLHLLLAEMNDYTGSILYDENELSQINREFLYDIVSTIQQSVFVFNASIKNNITMFGDYSREKINRVVQMSGLSDLVAVNGLDYMCGENGSNLSGGEKQRISIARALLRNSKVLLVDEATASLDAQTSSMVLNSFSDCS